MLLLTVYNTTPNTAVGELTVKSGEESNESELQIVTLSYYACILHGSFLVNFYQGKKCNSEWEWWTHSLLQRQVFTDCKDGTVIIADRNKIIVRNRITLTISRSWFIFIIGIIMNLDNCKYPHIE